MAMGNHLQPIPRFLVAAALFVVCLYPPAGHSQSLADALDTTNLVWTTGGDAPWIAQTTNTHDGVDAVRSGVIVSNQTSWIETTVVGPATVQYLQRSISDAGSLWLAFSVNGAALGLRSGFGFFDSFWTGSIIDLAVGTNVLRWTVQNSLGAGNNAVIFLDEFRVEPPRTLTILSQPATYSVYSGEWAYMTVHAIGTPPISYQWYKNGIASPHTNSFLEFNLVTENDAGEYSVLVSNPLSTTLSSTGVLTVLPPAPPFFAAEPISVTVYTGQGVSLSGSVHGSPPFHFQWRKDETNVPGAVGSQFWGTHGFTLTNVTTADAGNYTLFVTNDCGSVESSNAVLTVLPSIAPVITKHPRSLEVAEGVNTWLSVAAAGDPNPTYKWTKVGDIPLPPPPPPGPPPPPIIYQPSQEKRSFTNATPADAGIYFATAKFFGGEVVSREALLTVLPPITNLSSWWQGAQEVFVTNGLAFLAQDTFGFAILSVSNPVAPVMLGGYNTPGHASGVYANANWAYVVDGQSGLQIFSVTNPSNPILVGHYDTPFYLYDLVVRSNLAYLADGKTGLLIVSVSNPAAPALVGSFKSNFSADYVRVAGDYAFVSSRYSEALPGTNVAGFFVINVADPAHPFEVGRLARGIGRFDLRDQIVFGVTGSSLEVIAVTNPAQPVVIGSFQTYNYPAATNWPPRPPSTISASDVQVINDLAFVGGSSGDESRLFVVDVRDPFEPIPVGYYTNVGQRYALSVEGGVVYFAGIGSPLDIIRTPFATTPAALPRLTIAPPPGMQLGIHGRRGFHYALEAAAAPAGFPWETLQTVFLTNEIIALPLNLAPSNTFFRLKQLD